MHADTGRGSARRLWRRGWVLAVLVSVLLVAGAWSARRPLLQALPPTWVIALSAWRFGVQVDHGIVVTMADGAHLTASLYRPVQAQGPLPTVLVRLPYHRLRYSEGYNAGLYFARQGYAVLVQDLRGSGDSEGELMPWRDAADDGRQTLDWITRQPWSNGKVGGYGCSALGETQLVLTRARHPALVAVIPSGAGGAVGSAAGRYSPFGVFEGGVFQLASSYGWFVNSGAKDPHAPPARPFDIAQQMRGLPVSGLVRAVRNTPSAYDDYLATPLSDPRWAQWGFLTDSDRPSAAVLAINTWGDQTSGDALALAEQWRRLGVNQKVVIAAGNHCVHEESATDPSFGELPLANAAFPWREWYLRFFDKWLRGQGDGLDREANYSYFMLVENQWHTASTWPPAQVQWQRWHLDSAGHANTRSGDGRLQPVPPTRDAVDSFRYDPQDPVPTRGGPVCCSGDARIRPGPADQADVEARQDVLVYTSEPLAQDLRMAGPLKAHVTVSSSALDTDLVARLVHVWPDGHATSIQEGALRLRYREGIAHPRLLQPDVPVPVDVDMRSIAYKLPKGHRLRLQLTSSSFPRLERNLNTGAANNADETRMVVATNRVHHGPQAQAYLLLPVLP